ncbi:MAG: hypothetical protein ACJ72I_18635 [Pseudonocardiaceae bacterium]
MGEGLTSLIEPLRLLDLELAQDAVAASDAMAIKKMEDATLRQAVGLSQRAGALACSVLRDQVQECLR